MLKIGTQFFAGPKHGNEIPTIDVALVTVTPNDGGQEIGFTTSNKVQVTPQTETQDANKLIVKGVLIAQKPQQVTITGNTIVLTDNVLIPELLLILQGGTVTYKTPGDPSSGVSKYEPPVSGSAPHNKPFKLNLYSAIYNAAGAITGYEKAIYPNCQGTPWSPGSEDGVWRVAEYTINSAPNKGESPYTLEYVDDLPNVAEVGGGA